MQNNIKIYNQNPENINQKLNENMVFELTDNEAIEVKNIISFSEIRALRHKLNKWNANYLTSFSKTELPIHKSLFPYCLFIISVQQDLTQRVDSSCFKKPLKIRIDS